MQRTNKSCAGWLSCEKFRREYGKVRKWVYFVNEISGSAGNILIVNIELAKIKTSVLINLKWQNLDYPCYLVGITHVTFPVTTKRNIPLVEFVFTVILSLVTPHPKCIFSTQRFIVIYSPSGSTKISPHILSQKTRFSGKNLLDIKCVFGFLLFHLSKTFLILRRTQIVITINVHRS